MTLCPARLQQITPVSWDLVCQYSVKGQFETVTFHGDLNQLLSPKQWRLLIIKRASWQPCYQILRKAIAIGSPESIVFAGVGGLVQVRFLIIFIL